MQPYDVNVNARIFFDHADIPEDERPVELHGGAVAAPTPLRLPQPRRHAWPDWGCFLLPGDEAYAEGDPCYNLAEGGPLVSPKQWKAGTPLCLERSASAATDLCDTALIPTPPRWPTPAPRDARSTPS